MKNIILIPYVLPFAKVQGQGSRALASEPCPWTSSCVPLADNTKGSGGPGGGSPLVCHTHLLTPQLFKICINSSSRFLCVDINLVLYRRGALSRLTSNIGVWATSSSYIAYWCLDHLT